MNKRKENGKLIGGEDVHLRMILRRVTKKPRKAGDQPRENMFGSITILDPGRMNHYNEKQAQNVDDDVAFANQGALAPVITADPPFSVVFTV